MILSGKMIEKEVKKGNIIISIFNQNQLNPNSYDLRLDYDIGWYDLGNEKEYWNTDGKPFYLDVKKENEFIKFKMTKSGYLLYPNRLYLCKTIEYTKTDKYIPMINGKSSLGRLGLFIHVTAGYGDIGFSGHWTLELYCIHPIKIYPEMKICQIQFSEIKGDYELYHGKYIDQKNIESSKMYQSFK